MTASEARDRALDAAIAGRRLDQIGFVVPDLELAMEDFSANLGIGPWAIWEYVPPYLGWREYRGRPGSFSMRAAFAGSRPQVELIEPIEGPSIWHEFLEQRGVGIHHLAFFVDSFADTRAKLADLGIEMVMAGGGHGLDGDGAFGYFDAEARFGFVLEAIQHPARRRPPARLHQPVSLDQPESKRLR